MSCRYIFLNFKVYFFRKVIVAFLDATAVNLRAIKVRNEALQALPGGISNKGCLVKCKQIPLSVSSMDSQVSSSFINIGRWWESTKKAMDEMWLPASPMLSEAEVTVRFHHLIINIMFEIIL